MTRRIGLRTIHDDINHTSFPQAKRVGNPSPPPSPPWQGGEKGEVRTSRNDKLLSTYVVMCFFFLFVLSLLSVPALAEKTGGDSGKDFLWRVKSGAGHLVGDKGIVALLRKKGYRVDQI